MGNTIKFKKLTLRNFLSYGTIPVEVNLDNPGTTLIVGRNIDMESSGGGSNGVGKTSILNALAVVCFDQTIDGDVSKDELINNINKKNMEISVTFEKNGHEYYAYRSRKLKGGKDVYLTCDGVDITPDSIKAFNKKLVEIIGIPFELFSRIVTFSATSEPFLKLPSHHATKTNQIDIIEELLDLKSLSEKADLLKAKISDTERSLETKVVQSEHIKKEVERHATLLETAKQRVIAWERQTETELKNLRVKLDEFNAIDLDKEREQLQNYEQLTSKIQALNVKKDELSNEIKSLVTQYQQYKSTIASVEHVDVEQQQACHQQLRELTESLAEPKSTLSSVTKAVDTLQLERIRTNSKLTSIKNIDVDAQLQLHEQYSTVREQCETFTKTIHGYDAELTGLNEQLRLALLELSHLNDGSCPYCLQKFSSDEKVHQCKSNISDLTDKIHTIEQLRSVVITEHNDLVTKSTDVKSQLLSHTVEELYEIRNNQQSYSDRIAEVDQQLSELTTQQNELKTVVQLLEAKIADVKKQIVVDDINQLVDIKSKVETYKQKLADAEQATNQKSDAYDIVVVEVDKLNQQAAATKSDLIVSSVKELMDLQTRKNQLVERISALECTTNPHFEALEELERSQIEPFDFSEINTLNELIEHQKFLLKLLSKKDSFIRKALLNKNVHYLNDRLAHYLKEIGLPHVVKFNEEMGVTISKFGHELSFGSLSSGQKARVNIALSFAFRDVLQSRSEKINICLLDEVVDVGLDALGIQSVAHMLKRKAREDQSTMFIISHRDEVSGAFDRKMIVQMSEGFSNIVT